MRALAAFLPHQQALLDRRNMGLGTGSGAIATTCAVPLCAGTPVRLNAERDLTAPITAAEAAIQTVLLYRELVSSSWTTTFRTDLNRAQVRGNRVTNASGIRSRTVLVMTVAIDFE